MANHKKTLKELRLFGIALTCMMSVFGTISLWKGGGAYPYFYTAAGVVAFTTLVAPRVLTPIELVFATVAKTVITAFTYVVLTLFYFFALTPVAMLLKIIGKDPLNRAYDKSLDSYWIPVEVDGPGTRPDKPY